MARGGVAGKALSVGVAQRAGGAEVTLTWDVRWPE